MNILFLCGDMNRFGGTERACSIIANGLAQAGHTVTLLSVQCGLAPFFHIAPGVAVETLFLTPSRFLKRYPQIIWRLRKKLLAGKFDVLVDVESMLALVSIPAVAGLGIRHICWEHFSFQVDLGKKGRRVARHLAAKLCDDVLTLTERDRNQWEKGAKPHANIQAMPNPSPFQVQQSAYQIDSKIVLAIGRPIHLKGYDLLLSAWRTVSAHANGWTLRIVGSGDEIDELRSLCVRLEVAESVELLPATNDIATHYAQAAIYCLSSRSEGFPMVLIEALCFGLPIVSFDCNTGPREILEGCGIELVPEQDVSALAESLLALINNPAKRQVLSDLARSRANIYQPEKIISRWSILLEQ